MSWFHFPFNHYVKTDAENIESKAEKVANRTHPGPVDIELNAEKNGYKMDYQFLSHNGCYLGMAVFETTHKIPIYDEIENCAKYHYAQKNTIIIDNRLLDKGNENRYRFTVGHELGHLLLHSSFFNCIPGTMSNEMNSVLCRSAWRKPKKEERSLADYLEIQANRFSAAVLMPRTAFFELAHSYDHISSDTVRFVDEAARTFAVSPHAVCLRLNELHILDFSYDTYCDIKHSATVR